MPSSANRPENGGISFRVPEEAQGWRLDKALGLLLASPSPEQEAARPGLFALADLGLRARRRLCDRSLVLVNGKPGIPGLKLRAGQEIIILPDPEGAAIPKDAPSLVYKDGGIAALYKPAGMHTAALAGSLSPSLETLLGDLLPSEEEGYASRLLNRLDAPTSGLVLASCTDGGERRWYRAERIGNTDKLYLALIEGQPLYDFTVARRLDTDTRNKTRVRHTDDPDPVRHTDVTLLAPLTAGDVPGLVESDDPDAPLMLVGCRIRKGARHQIRAHLAAAGHPLAGESRYGADLPCPSGFLLPHGRVSLPEFQAFFLFVKKIKCVVGGGKLLIFLPPPLSKPLPSSSNIFVFIESLPPSFPVYGGAFAPTSLNMSSSPWPRRVPGGTVFLCCSSLPKKFSITNALILLSTFPVCLLDPFLSSTTAAFMNQTF